MKPVELSQDALNFILTKIDSVPHMEALLLLYEQSGEHWTAELMASRLYVSTQRAGQILADLARRKLARQASETASQEYVYSPDTDATAQVMVEVVFAYRRKLSAVTMLIHEKGLHSVQEFARAFKLRKGD